MSHMGQRRVELQETDAYQAGWEAADEHYSRSYCVLYEGEEQEAWLLGYDDRTTQETAP